MGHPYAPIGRGEDVRCTFRAMRSVAMSPGLRDIYGFVMPDAEQQAEFGAYGVDSPGHVNIFHINGDEVDQALAHLSYHRAWSGYNIVYPAWELERYPDEWARQLDRFDEIWAPSRFVEGALKLACTKPVFWMPLAAEVLLPAFLGRRYFGIREEDYVFLFFFDTRSYPTRKNPQAVLRAFRHLLALRPSAKAHLVLKTHGKDGAQALEDLKAEVGDAADRVTFLNREMSDAEVKNLVRCCDCFVSLHRSEGFGRGIAEAMVLGKPVIATAYSGNLDFMNAEVAFPVGYQPISLREGDYPFWENQIWADPDWQEAGSLMAALIDNPGFGRMIGERAHLYIVGHFGLRASGMRYRRHLEGLLQ